LDRIVPDRSSSASHQDGLVGYRPVYERTEMCGHARDPETRTFSEADTFREFRHQVRSERDEFARRPEGASALPVIKPDPLPDAPWINLGPNAINDAGAIAVGDNARIFHHKTSAAPPIAVGWIDAGGMETNPDLADRGFRIRKFTKRENLCGRPLPIIPDGFHIITYFTGLLSKSEGSEPLGGSPQRRR
jgi:hypothetical protein